MPSEKACAFLDSDFVRRRFAECGLGLGEAVVEDFPVSVPVPGRAMLTDASREVA